MFAFPLSLSHHIAELGLALNVHVHRAEIKMKPNVNLKATGLEMWKPNKGTITSRTDLGT